MSHFQNSVVSKRQNQFGQNKGTKKAKNEMDVITLDDALGLDDVEVLANKFGIKLNKEQLGCLEPTVWLNGETVNFYHQMIVQQNKSDLNLPPVVILIHHLNSDID
uniref:Uncharacterized protein n=1 Tax=Ditylenchus dipsaci TaxID=166011 RepID=A0A915DAD2_9BILA